MADYEQVMEALRRADAAGNVEDARRLAEMARGLRGNDLQLQAAATSPDQSVSPGPVAEPFTGNILPMSGDDQGNVRFDSDAGILGAVKRAVQLPAQVYRGEIDPLSEEGAGRALEMGLTVTPMGAAARASGANQLVGGGYRQQARPVPTREALQKATEAGYKEAREMGAEYNPQAVSGWAAQVADSLNAEGRIAENYPKVHRLLEALKTPPDGAKSITLESIDALYKELGRLGADPVEGSVASIVQRQLDDFHYELGPEGLVAGTASPQRAAEVLREARGNAAAGFRSDRVTGMEKTSARRTAAANSGRNADNNIRQRLTSLIESAKGSRGLNAEEEAFIDTIIFGTRAKNAARYTGNLLGGGGGLGSTLLSGAAGVGGATALGPLGAALAAIPPVAGATARGMANSMSRKELARLDELLRSRSPLADEMPAPMPVYRQSVPQAVAETGLRAAGAGQLPVYQPRQSANTPHVSPEILRALLASPNGA